MSHKRLVIRVSIGAVLVAAGVASWGVMNATALKADFAARQLRTAATDEDRARAADRLAGLGDHGLARLVEFIRAGDAPARTAAATAIDQRLSSLPAGDLWAVTASERLLAAFAGADAGGQRTILERLPSVLRSTAGTHAAECRDAVSAGLRSPDPATRVLAVRLAFHTAVNLQAEIVSLLADSKAEVRRVALAAVALAAGSEPLLLDEELFRWLHDPDEGVRRICHDALIARNRTETEIRLGRRLTNPDCRERLKLLLDLRYDSELADPEPWLERLSRDVEPGVRAGAARVAVEVSAERRLGCPPWVGRVAEADPDATVRRVARYFRDRQLVIFDGKVGARRAP